MLIDKKIFIGIIMLFLSFTLLTGCEDSILSGQTSFKKTGSINGTIVNEQDEFLSNVSVTIGNKTDNTGDRGIFQITSLETG